MIIVLIDNNLLNIRPDVFVKPKREKFERAAELVHEPRILLWRARSYSRFMTQEAALLLQSFGADTKIFDPSGLPLPDDAPADHPKVQTPRSQPMG